MIAPAYMAYILDMGEWGKRARACEVMKYRGASREVLSIMTAPMPNENAMDEAWDRIYKRQLEGVRERWREHDLRVAAKVAKQLEYERVQRVNWAQQAEERDRLRQIEQARVAEQTRVRTEKWQAQLQAEAEHKEELRNRAIQKSRAKRDATLLARKNEERVRNDMRARYVHASVSLEKGNLKRANKLFEEYGSRYVEEIPNVPIVYQDYAGHGWHGDAHLLDCPVDVEALAEDDRIDPEWESFCLIPAWQLRAMHISPRGRA